MKEVTSLPVRNTSAWDAEQITQYLTSAAQPLRLSVLVDDAPMIVPLWYRFDQGVFWCASQRSARTTAWVQAHPNCGFDVSTNDMPYKGVRGQGTARLVAQGGAEVLQQLVTRYLGDEDTPFSRWLLGRSTSEVAIVIEPKWLTAWDFSARMPPGAGGPGEAH